MWDSNPRFLCKDFALKAIALPLGQSGAFVYNVCISRYKATCVRRLRTEDTYFSAEYIRFHQSVNLASLLSDKTGCDGGRSEFTAGS